MEKKVPPPPKPPASKAVVLVGKGPPPASGPPKGAPPGAKIAVHGSGPPPGKASLPKPPASGLAAAGKLPAATSTPPKTPSVSRKEATPSEPPVGGPTKSSNAPSVLHDTSVKSPASPGSPPKTPVVLNNAVAPPKPPLDGLAKPAKAVPNGPPVALAKPPATLSSPQKTPVASKDGAAPPKAPASGAAKSSSPTPPSPSAVVGKPPASSSSHPKSPLVSKDESALPKLSVGEVKEPATQHSTAAKNDLPKPPPPTSDASSAKCPPSTSFLVKDSPKPSLDKSPGNSKTATPKPPSLLGSQKQTPPSLPTAKGGSVGPPGSKTQEDKSIASPLAAKASPDPGLPNTAKVAPGPTPLEKTVEPPTSAAGGKGPPGPLHAGKGSPGPPEEPKVSHSLPVKSKALGSLQTATKGTPDSGLPAGTKVSPGPEAGSTQPAAPPDDQPTARGVNVSKVVPKQGPPNGGSSGFPIASSTPVASATSRPTQVAPESKIGDTASGGSRSAQAFSSGGSLNMDEYGRQRGSVGNLAPKSELSHDLAGNVIPVFDKEGKFVAFTSGPPAPLSRSDPARRSRRLSDRRPEEREAMKGPFERGIDQGALGGVRVPGGIPGFFLSVPPWPAPTPMPMDQSPGWAAYPPIPSYSMPQVSPYAAFLPQPLSQVPYPMIYAPGGEDGSQHGLLPQQGSFRGAAWPGYPRQTDAADVRGSSFIAPQEISQQKDGKSQKGVTELVAQMNGPRARGYMVASGDHELGKTKWLPIERHLNNIRGGYGESYRPPEEADGPPRKPSNRARRRSSSVRDDVYSGFRPYYSREKKPFVDEVIPRYAEPREPSGSKPTAPRKSALMTRPKDRTWDRWGSTGLTAPRKRTYQSLSELANCFSNLDAEDQEDVISLLLLCRKLEQQVEKQHVVIDMLEHDLSEAQKVLKFPPEWRPLEGLDFAGMAPSGRPVRFLLYQTT
ncbi:hypothetical protein, conserved [Eimeria tenella]|uniref:Uncharacterized protein n=1 Tax=Eimeria tenella TaxID=5802 RepID=U6KXQ6_EIMTE|nr:hypothetical protein, conserved [Eimeria tenella]CDJ40280.1 hypothetical protein, conserved [Eimeria tenella]|eukprot:XP_013231033.1 hypothetical protein, conserved [Eimeria tenella]